MSNDILNQTIKLADGRVLGYAQYGDLAGQPVFHFHGSASSRLERPPSEDILFELGIHFISVDRPGHGLSDIQPDRRLTDWPEDIRQLADHLGIDQFFVNGHSAGGPHALACAHQLPERVLAGSVVSSIAPMSRPGAYKSMPFLNQVLARSARQIPWFTMFIRGIARRMVMGDPEKATQQLMSSLPESDKSLLYSPENVQILVASLREGFGQGSQSVALDDILVNTDWGFDLQDITIRIEIWHGDADPNVPVHAGEYLQKTLPNHRAHLLEGEGHFFILSRWAEILSALLGEGLD